MSGFDVLACFHGHPKSSFVGAGLIFLILLAGGFWA